MNDEIADALMFLIEATRDEEQRRKEYVHSGGWEWGWAGHEYTQRKNDAAERFASVLNNVIDARVKEILKAKEQAI